MIIRREPVTNSILPVSRLCGDKDTHGREGIITGDEDAVKSGFHSLTLTCISTHGTVYEITKEDFFQTSKHFNDSVERVVQES